MSLWNNFTSEETISSTNIFKSYFGTQPNFVFHDAVIFPSAKAMSFLAYKKFQNNDFEDVAYFEPFYLKDFILKTKQSI